MRLSILVLASAAATAGAAGSAHAAEVSALSVQLDYVAVPGCPAPSALESLVAERLGYSPFRPEASERVIARVGAAGNGIAGTLEWRNPDGAWVGERTFPSKTGDCGELVRAMAFALALQFQLRAAPPPPAEPPVVTAKAIPVAAPPPPAATTAPAPPVAAGPSIAAGAGVSAGLGVAPGLGALGRLFAEVAWPRFSAEVAAEASLPTEAHFANGSGFSHRVWAASLAGCGTRGRWNACLLAKAGEIRVTGTGVDLPATASRLLVQAGLRVAISQPLGRRAYAVLHADGLGLLMGGIVTLDRVPVWTTPRVAGILGLDLGVRFP